ncbi:hypothetical protein, partial [Pseudomonas rubra]
VSGRRIIQRFNPLSTTFFTATDLSIEAPPALSRTANSLKLKEFSVPTAPEVGRIIEKLNRTSRANLKTIKQRHNHSLYIDRSAGKGGRHVRTLRTTLEADR